MKQRVKRSVLLLSLLLLLSACGGKEEDKVPMANRGTGAITVTDILQNAENAQSAEAAAPVTANGETHATISGPQTGIAAMAGFADEEEDDGKPKARPGDYDIDLATLSDVMIYSQLLNMATTPDDFLGQHIRMMGLFASYEGAERRYFSCQIQTICCLQEIEFVLAGNPAYPDDYPKEGDWIVVTGTFGTYVEDGKMYCQLIDAVLEEYD